MNMADSPGLNFTAMCEAYYPLPVSAYIDFVVTVFSVSIFIIGVTSWNVIRDFKSFKNYICLCIIINYITNAIIRNLQVECIADKFSDRNISMAVLFTSIVVYTYLSLTVNYWYMVLFYDTYLNVVKVYNNHITRRYLKANLWAWGVPLLINLLVYLVIPGLVEASASPVLIVQMLFTLLPVVFNVIIYFIVLCSMLKMSCSSKVSTIGGKRYPYLRMIVLLFIICVLSVCMTIMGMSGFDQFTLCILVSLQDLTLCLYFLTGSENRSLWREYYGRSKNIRLHNTTEEIVIQGSDETV